MIAIIDYGLGNVKAFLNVYKRLNIVASVARTSSELNSASKLILPGVGSFDCAMELLRQSGMRDALDELVLGQSIPVLGVCVGMQILASSSEEGQLDGLGWIDGQVRKFDVAAFRQPAPLPHMGWNDVWPVANSGIFGGLENDARFYFLHSYFFQCKQNEHVIAQADYGAAFTCAVKMKNIYGVQFHPEKSHDYGARLLKNFAEL